MIVENKYKVKDEALFAAVQKLKDGADGDYNLVYELSEKYIYKIINDIVKNHHTTEDLMQETYLQIYNKIDTLQDARAFYVWAGRIATNLTLRHVQKYRKETLAVADEEGSTDFVFDVATDDNECFIPENALMDKEKQRLIAEIIDNLSVEQKLSVQYFYYEEMSVRDIAQVMECSEGTVKSRLNYARKSIKDAVIDLDVKQGTRLYSLGSLPLFWLVFRESVEAFVTAELTAAAGVAGSAEGAVGGASSIGTAEAVGGSAGAVGTVGGASAAGGAGGSVAAGVAGSIGGAGSTGTGIAATVAGDASSVGTTGTVAGSTASSAGSVVGTVGGSTGSSAVGAVTSSAGNSMAVTVAEGATTSAEVSATTGTTKVATSLVAKLFGTAAGKVIAGIIAAVVVIGIGVVVMLGGEESKPTVDRDTVENDTQEPENMKLPDGIANELSIEYRYIVDINNKEYWETHTNYTELRVGLYPEKNNWMNYVIGEYSYSSGESLSPEIIAFFDLYAPEEEAKLFFSENQDTAATRKEDVYSVDVTEDFPETLEFDFDGMHFVANISKVTKNILFTPSDQTNAMNESFNYPPVYTSSFSSENNGDVENWYAYAVAFRIDATFTCDGNILESQYARDKAGTYLHGEPSRDFEMNNKIYIEYGFQPYMPENQVITYGYYGSGQIRIGTYECKSLPLWTPPMPHHNLVISERFEQEYGDADPKGLFKVFNAYIPEEQLQAFFDTYKYVAAENEQGRYYEDISAMYPKTLEFDYGGMHFVVNVQDVQRYILGSSEVRIYLEGTYTCDGDITASSYAKDAYGNYLHGNPGEMAP